MKKIISIILFSTLATFGLTSCDTETNEDAGGTNVEKMAGFWDVNVDAVKSDGTISKDPLGVGTISIMTYNTASNDLDSIFIDDSNKFYNIKFKVPVNYATKTFTCESKCYNPYVAGSGNAVVTEGAVLEDKGHNIHNLPCDSISFKIKFDDDNNHLTYLIHGIRHSGFTE